MADDKKKKKHVPDIFTINPCQMENIPTPRGGKNRSPNTSSYTKQKKVR